MLTVEQCKKLKEWGMEQSQQGDHPRIGYWYLTDEADGYFTRHTDAMFDTDPCDDGYYIPTLEDLIEMVTESAGATYPKEPRLYDYFALVRHRNKSYRASINIELTRSGCRIAEEHCVEFEDADTPELACFNLIEALKGGEKE